MKKPLTSLAILLLSVCPGATSMAAEPSGEGKQPQGQENQRLWEEAKRVAETITRDLGGKAVCSHALPAHACVCVDLHGLPVTDAELERLKGMSQIGELSLEGTEVTDNGLAHLEGLTQLTSLSLGHTRVTDAGLKRLARMPRLQALDLEGTKVTNTGLAFLKAATILRSLNLARTPGYRRWVATPGTGYRASTVRP